MVFSLNPYGYIVSDVKYIPTTVIYQLVLLKFLTPISLQGTIRVPAGFNNDKFDHDDHIWANTVLYKLFLDNGFTTLTPDHLDGKSKSTHGSSGFLLKA